LKSLLNSSLGKIIQKRQGVVVKKVAEDDEDEESEESEESDESESEDEKEEVRYNHFKKTKIEDNLHEEHPQPKTYEKHYEVFIDNFPVVGQDEIKEYFNQIDENLKVKLLSRNGKFTGKGFLKFNTKKEAETFLKENSKLKINNQRLNMRMINPDDNTADKSTNNGNNSFYTAFLGNLPTTITDDKVKKLFKGISKIRLMTNKEGKSKGFGYVDFKSEEDLEKALSKKVVLDGKEVKSERAKTSFNTQVLKDSKRLTKKRHRDNN
jgi:RNA recognition motif-containing protein